MDYKVVMPILSDTMDYGKLIKWHVKEGDFVKKGDILAEVESDKAIMEVDSFVDGVVKKILVKEGEKVKVKEPIAIIDTDAKVALINPKQENKKENETHSIQIDIEKIEIAPIDVKGVASAAAKIEAKKSGIDIEKLQKENILPKPAHLKDIEEVKLQRYFTPKALKLLKEYEIDANIFNLDHKIDEEEVKEFIFKNNLAKQKKVSKNQIAIIKNVENASKKPTFFIFEEFETKKIEGIKLTANIIKALALSMQEFELTRAKLKNDKLLIYPNSNISVALQREDGLYMVVCKEAQNKSLIEISNWLKEIKTKTITSDDLIGSTFGISNLGMFNIKSFTALINKEDSGIMAVGKFENNKFIANFTFDHRIINGAYGAKFVNSIKENLRSIDV